MVQLTKSVKTNVTTYSPQAAIVGDDDDAQIGNPLCGMTQIPVKRK
jgi:hypothetical protein